LSRPAHTWLWAGTAPLQIPLAPFGEGGNSRRVGEGRRVGAVQRNPPLVRPRLAGYISLHPPYSLTRGCGRGPRPGKSPLPPLAKGETAVGWVQRSGTHRLSGSGWWATFHLPHPARVCGRGHRAPAVHRRALPRRYGCIYRNRSDNDQVDPDSISNDPWPNQDQKANSHSDYPGHESADREGIHLTSSFLSMI